MATYTFRDKNTNEVFDVIMSMNDYEDYKVSHPDHERYFDEAPQLISGHQVKTDAGFNEVLTKISEAHPTSPLADNHLRKSIKQVKTERAVKEWRKKTSTSL